MGILKAFRVARDFFRPNKYELKKYLINDGKKHPFALICPGGGYFAVCSFVEGEPFAKELNRRGYHAFVVYYRVKDRAQYPAPQEDVARALREILAHAQEWNLDTRAYSLWGSSAGGHLAASFGTDAMGYRNYDLPKPSTLVLTYPVVTMGEKTHIGSRENLLGKDAEPGKLDFASVEKQITANYPPTFLWCGDADQTVDPVNCEMLEAALKEKGIPHLRKCYPGVDHGVGLGQGLACEGWFDEAVKFWERCRDAVPAGDISAAPGGNDR